MDNFINYIGLEGHEYLLIAYKTEIKFDVLSNKKDITSEIPYPYALYKLLSILFHY